MHRLLNLIYPRRCPLCDGLTGSYDRLVCKECRGKVPLLVEPLCKKCGKPLEKEEAEYCEDCGRKTHAYTKGRAAFAYDELMRASISRFKYRNRREYADFYVQELLRSCAGSVRSWGPEALIPIPLHKSRMRSRGFNQAELVARGLGEILEIPVENALLVRAKRTRPQKDLNYRERAENLKNAFQVTQNDVELKKVLLIDDIYTTGSTVDAAAKALKERGVEKVYFLSICIGRGV